MSHCRATMPGKKQTHGANTDVLQTFSFKASWCITPAVPQTSNKCHKAAISLLLSSKPFQLPAALSKQTLEVFCYFSSFIKLDNGSAVSSSNVLFQSATSEARQRQLRFSPWPDFADLLHTSGKRLRDSVVVIKMYLGRRSQQAVSLFWMICSH